MAESLTYSGYLRLDELLDLQTLRSEGPHGAEHDELLFVVIHQVYELWFKQLLHEIDYLGDRLRQNESARATHTIRRILTILKTIVAQVDVLETMTPVQFNAFRGYLATSSGFQSAQFRELEFALGYKRPAILNHFLDDPRSHERLTARYAQPTLWDAFLHYLALNGYAISVEHLRRDVTEPIEPSPELQMILIDIYRTDPATTILCERLLDMDEGLQEWRYRHVKMVERMIGSKPGTGGSPGAQYLMSTIKPFFPDLWAIRSEL